AVAANLEEIASYDLSRDFFNRYVDGIRAVTQNDVRRVARQYVQPDRFVVVVVGDREKIEAGIRALKLGPVTIMSVEDVLGERPEIGSTN
ncbi:MAG: hypothetical protein OEO17_09915, partial [Gemmatimonadota bacterium]|nr:hypothetical protein [Gemmatimonadota bacterium]